MSRSLNVGLHVPFSHRQSGKKPEKVKLWCRDFDGIETNYDDICTMTPDEARYIGQELIKAANSIDNKPAKDRTTAKMKKALQKTIDEARDSGEVPGQ